jgi:hypothetical protein
MVQESVPLVETLSSRYKRGFKGKLQNLCEG